MFRFGALLNPGGLLLTVNQAPLELAQLSMEDLVGRPVWTTYWWSHSLSVQEEIRQSVDLAASGKAARIKIPARMSSERMIDVDLIIAPQLHPDGRTDLLVCAAVDETERKLAEARALQLQSTLAHMCRVSTMGELASGIAHELNQPMAAIAMYAFSAANAIEGEVSPAAQECRDLLQQISEQVLRAGDILRRLRRFVRKSAPHRSTRDIPGLITEVVAMLAPQTTSAKARIDLRFDAKLPLLLVDAIQIQQVLMNLLRNALEAVQDVVSGPRDLLVSATLFDENNVLVSVQDSGPGPPPQVADRLFEPFCSAKPQGLGLGLSISRSIIEAHGGRIWAERNHPQGAVFRFLLPIKPKV